MRPLRVLLRAPAIGARAIAVAFAFVVAAVFGAACYAVHDLATNEQAVAQHTAADAATVARMSRVGAPNDRSVADGLAARLHGSRLDVQVHPLPGAHVRAQTPAGVPHPELGTTLVALLTGVHAIHVPVGRFDVSIGPDLRGLATMAKRVFAGALGLDVVIGLVMFALLRALNREATRPLKQTTDALRRLAARDFTPHPVDASQAGEIGDLARAYRQAAETVATALEERRLAESEMQRFIADAGHELKTPLAVIIGFVDVLERGGLAEATTARLYGTVRAESNRMRGMIEKLIALARLGTSEPAHLDLVDARRVAEAVAYNLTEIASPRTIAVEHDGAPAVVVAAEDDLYDAIFNCVDNALKYGGGSDVRIRIARAAGRVRIEVRDGGPGMPEAERSRAFERFYRSDRTRGVPGSGLGLAIVRRVAERCGGTADIASGAPGTVVSMDLPAVPDASREIPPGVPA